MADNIKLWHDVRCPAVIPSTYNTSTKEFESLPCTCGYESQVQEREKAKSDLGYIGPYGNGAMPYE